MCSTNQQSINGNISFELILKKILQFNIDFMEFRKIGLVLTKYDCIQTVKETYYNETCNVSLHLQYTT